jgi:hypothetical protein
MEPQQRRPRLNLGCSAIGWMDWLLLWCGIIQSVPYNCDYLLICCASDLSSNNSRLIHQRSLFWLQRTPNSKTRRNLARNVRGFCLQVSLFIPLGFFNMP